MDQERMRRLLNEYHCPYCSEGPWKSVANHIWSAHEKRAADVKAEAGIPKSHSLISPGTKAKLSAEALRRDSVSNMEGLGRPGNVHVSEAGRQSWKDGIRLASAARTRIPLDQHDTIRERLRNGEQKKDLAAEYGVSRARIRQIEQYIEYVPVRRIASR